MWNVVLTDSRSAQSQQGVTVRRTDFMDVPAAPKREELRRAVCSATLRVPWTLPQCPRGFCPIQVMAGAGAPDSSSAEVHKPQKVPVPITATQCKQTHEPVALLQARSLPPQGLDPRSRPQGRTKRSSQERLKTQFYCYTVQLQVAHIDAPVAKNRQGISHRLQSHPPAWKAQSTAVHRQAIKGATRLTAPHKG